MPSSAWLTLVYFPVSAATAVRLMEGRAVLILPRAMSISTAWLAV